MTPCISAFYPLFFLSFPGKYLSIMCGEPGPLGIFAVARRCESDRVARGKQGARGSNERITDGCHVVRPEQ